MLRRAAMLAFPPAFAALVVAAPPVGPSPEVARAWLDRMSEEDRGCLERIVGSAPPAFTDDLRWHNSELRSWEALRGKVVVMQSWCTRRSSTFRNIEAAAQTVEDAGGGDAVLIALHTPEGADNAGRFLDRRGYDGAAIVDPGGAFCDALGVYKRPVNLVIDRHGFVRFVGLNHDGLRSAVETLIAERFEPDNRPPTADDEAPPAGEVDFPVPSLPVKNSTDMRGRRAPDFYVDEWINRRPDARDRVVVIDFWATWCGPCVATLPHLNDLADRFRGDAVVIGLSNESRSAFEQGMRKRNLAVNDLRYHLAIDPSQRMLKAVGVTGIPTTLVMSSDWVVRWQGHPADLDPETFAQIVEANRVLVASLEDVPCHRWANDRR